MSDKRHKQQRRRDAARDPVTGLSEYEKIMTGEIEPQGMQKGWKNLKPIPITQRDPEERREICRKGAQAVQRIRGEEKSAKESLERMLKILATDDIIAQADIDNALAERLKRENPDMTLYDVMNAAALGRAISGNVKAAEYVRDTRGDKPHDTVEINANITTDQDRELMQRIADRLNDPNIEVVKTIEQ